MKFILFFLICIIFSACISQWNKLRKPEDFDSIKRVSYISFFGKVNYGNISNSKEEVMLLYKGNALKYVAAGKKFKKDNKSYKIITLNDSINMLTANFMGPRYQDYDTLLFFRDFCFRKIVDYDHPLLQGREAVMTVFVVYQFAKDSLITFDKRILHKDSVEAKEPVYDYANRYVLSISNKNKSTYTQRTSMYYRDREAAKQNFIRDFLS